MEPVPVPVSFIALPVELIKFNLALPKLAIFVHWHLQYRVLYGSVKCICYRTPSPFKTLESWAYCSPNVINKIFITLVLVNMVSFPQSIMQLCQKFENCF